MSNVTHDEFIKLFKGIPLDFDKALGVQCMDLVHYYVFIVLGIHDESVLSANVAKNVWFNFNPKWDKYFKKIANVYGDLGNFPSKGDIIVWDGLWGHIAIVNDATGRELHSFDANYPAGSNPHLQRHDYTNVLGWLRPVPQPEPESKFVVGLKQIKDIVNKLV